MDLVFVFECTDWSPREREQCNNGDQPYPTFFSAYPEIVTYTGPNQTPYDADRLADLMRLPTVLCASGMARIEFTTDQSVTYSGFALRFFAIHRFRGRILFTEVGCSSVTHYANMSVQ